MWHYYNLLAECKELRIKLNLLSKERDTLIASLRHFRGGWVDTLAINYNFEEVQPELILPDKQIE
jgi:hypothetical protein